MGIKDLFDSVEPSLPPANRLDQAVRELGRYYIVDPDTYSISDDQSGTSPLNPSDSSPTLSSRKDSEDIVRYIKSLVLDTSSGATHAATILEKGLGDLSGVKDIEKFIYVRLSNSVHPNSPLNTTVTRDSGMGVLDVCGSVALDPNRGSESQIEGESLSGVITKVAADGNLSASPNKLTDPHLSAIQINHVQVHPANSRNAAGSIFFNSIPTIEMSQCVPFIRISFESDNNKSSNMSLFGFCQDPSATNTIDWAEFGSEDINWSNFKVDRDYRDIGSDIGEGVSFSTELLGSQSEVNTEPVTRYSTGIELFQSPQTLNTMGFSAGANNTQLNPAAPIATLQSLTVDITGLGLAVLSNKTAAMDIIVHDRSSMRFLAPLIGATSFAGTSVSIEMGWMHPQATASSEGNEYANFLNSIRVKSDFNIQVSQTSLQADGQVRVGLKLASRGVSDLSIIPAGSGIEYVPATVLSPFLTRLVDSINKAALAKAGAIENPEENSLVEVNPGIQVSGNFKSPTSLIPLEYYRSLLEVFSEASEKSGNEKAQYQELIASECANIINDILDDQSSQTSDTKYNTLMNSLYAKKRSLEHRDIFVDDDPGNAPIRSQAIQRASDQGSSSPIESTEDATNNIGSTMPSLGSVLLTYVGRPMQAVGKFDEVQFVFYPFNSLAGKMNNVNMAEFALEDFDGFIGEIAQESPSISTRAFIEKIFSSAYGGGPGNPAHPNYGLSQYYSDIKSKLENVTDSNQKKQILKGLEGERDRVLEQIYENTNKPPVFELPDVSVHIESLPSKIKDGDKTRDTTILRIHIFDAKAGIKDSVALLQQIQAGPTLTIQGEGTEVADTEATQVTRGTSAESTEIDDFKKNKIIGSKRVDTGQEIHFSLKPMSELKNAIKSVYPSITFGTQFTNVKNVSVSSNTGGAVNQVLLMNAVSANRKAGTAPQEDNNLEDVFVIPASITLTTEGFPLTTYAEKYYIDLGTGTTMDNFYYVVGIKHSITPGGFTTTLQMAYNGSATRKSIISQLEAAEKLSNS